MTPTQKKMIDEGEKLLHSIDGIEAAKGYLRYETIRKLSLNELSANYHRNYNGENFDNIIDQLTVERLSK